MLAVSCEDLGILPDVTIFRSSGFTLATHLLGSINQITEELREGGALRVNFATNFEDAVGAARR